MVEFRLKVLLIDKNTTQRDLAGMTGLSIPTLSKICTNNAKTISVDTIDKICSALDCYPEDWIIYKKVLDK